MLCSPSPRGQARVNPFRPRSVQVQGLQGPRAPAELPSRGPELATEHPPSLSYLQTRDAGRMDANFAKGRSWESQMPSLLIPCCLPGMEATGAPDGGGLIQINKRTSFGQMSGPFWLLSDGPSLWWQAQHRGTRWRWQPRLSSFITTSRLQPWPWLESIPLNRRRQLNEAIFMELMPLGRQLLLFSIFYF